MGPFGDPQSAAMVLLLDCVADINKFAIFEDEEVVLGCEGIETGNSFVAEVGEDINVCFDHCNVRAKT